MANSFTFNSVDYSTYGLLVTNVERWGFAPVRLDAQQRGGGTGASVGDAVYYGAGVIRLRCMVRATTIAARQGYLDSIRAGLAPTLGQKLLLLDDETGQSAAVNRGYLVLLQSMSELALRPGAYVVEFDLEFLVPRGCAVAAVEVDRTVTLTGSPQTVYEPNDVAAVVYGTRRARPVWEFTNSSATPVSSVTLANVTAGTTMTWTGTLAQGDKLRLYAFERHAEKYRAAQADWMNAMYGFGSAQGFVELLPTVRNQLTVTGIASGSVRLIYRGEFL